MNQADVVAGAYGAAAGTPTPVAAQPDPEDSIRPSEQRPGSLLRKPRKSLTEDGVLSR